MTSEGNNNHDIYGKRDGNDGLSRKYHHASRELPPAHIDESILAASRNAVNSKQGWVIALFSDHWRIPVSIAAVLVLSVSVVFNLPDDAIRMDYEQDFNSADDAALILVESDEIDNFALAEMAGQAKQEAFNSNAAPSPARTESISTSFSDDPQLLMDLQRSIAPAVELESQFQQNVPSSDIVISAQRRQVFEYSESPASLTTTPIINDVDNASSELLLRGQIDNKEDRALSDTATTTVDDAKNIDYIVVSAEESESSPLINTCTLPRPDVCAEIFMPVCGVRNTGIQCITTPCDSIETVEFENACAACSNQNVMGYIEGKCSN